MVKFAEHYVETSSVQRRFHRFLQIGPAVGLFVGFAYAYRATPVRAMLLGLFTAVFFLVVSRLVGPRTFRGIMRQTLKEGSTASFVGHHAVTLDEAGFSMTSPHSQGRMAWTAVSRLEETADYLYFHILAGSGLVVPKRAFPDPAAGAAFFARARDLHAASHAGRTPAP